MHFAVCGLHLRGGPLNHQLVTAGGKFVRATMTSGDYTMHALSDASTPLKPGLVLHPGGAPGAASIPVEVWDMPEVSIGALLNFVPSPLGFGTVILEDGEKVKGFVCEGWAADPEKASLMGVAARDITAYGGWNEFVGKGMGKEKP